MTLRERIADWISGGALTRAKMLSEHDEYHLRIARTEFLNAYRRLRRIAAEETPKANATVKRMAAIARGER